MDDYREKSYEKYLSMHLKDVQSGSEEEYGLYYRYFKKNYKRFLPRRKDARILDIGCGMGHFLYFLQQENYSNVTGIDLGEEQVNFCKQKGFDVTKAEAFKFLQKNHGDFDCIIMNDVLEHLKKDEILKLLTLIRERMRNRGVLIVKTINMANFLTGPRNRYIDFTHEVAFTEESLSQVLDIARFNEVKIYPQDLYVLKNPIINLLAKTAAFILHKIFRLLFLLHGAKSTHIFTKHIIAVARK